MQAIIDAEPTAVPRALDEPLSPVHALGAWLESLWDGFSSAIAAEFRDSSKLEAALERLVELRSLVESQAISRPFGVPLALAREMTKRCVAMAQAYLGCLMARTPLDAQRLSDKGQAERESLDELVRQLGDWLDRQAAFCETDNTAEALRLLFMESIVAVGAETLLESTTIYQARLAELTGVAPDIASAIEYGVHGVFADTFLSRTDFEAKASGAFQVLVDGRSRVEGLLRSPDFQSDLRRLRLELFDAGVACQRFLAGDTHVRQAARQIVEVHATLVEAAGPLLAIPLLTATGVKSAPYTKLRGGNSTELLSRVFQEGELQSAAAGFRTQVRIAQAHRAIVYGDTSFVADLDSGRLELTYEELIDLTFEAMESLLAMLLAIRLFYSEVGEEELDADLTDIGLSSDEVARLVLSNVGMHDVSVNITDELLTLDLPRASMIGLSPTLSGLLCALPALSAQTLRVRLKGAEEWVCPIAPYRTFRTTSEPFDKQVALMRVQAAWRDPDEQPWLPDRVTQKWVATQVVESISLDVRERFRRYRLLRELMMELGQEDCVEFMRAVSAWARLAADGWAGEAEAEVLARAIEWSGYKVSFDLI